MGVGVGREAGARVSLSPSSTESAPCAVQSPASCTCTPHSCLGTLTFKIGIILKPLFGNLTTPNYKVTLDSSSEMLIPYNFFRLFLVF